MICLSIRSIGLSVMLLSASFLFVSCFTAGNKDLLKEENHELRIEPIPMLSPFPARLSDMTKNILGKTDSHYLLQELVRQFPESPDFPSVEIAFQNPSVEVAGQAS